METFRFQILVFFMTFMIRGALGAKKSKCEIVQALRTEGVPDSDLRDWLCLVKHESDYVYDLQHVNPDNSIDYGIFQFNSNYTCGKTGGVSSSICWQLRTYGCADACSAFIDSYISNDANCAVRVRNCDGFKPWDGWTKNCANVSGHDYDYSSCNLLK